MNHPVVCTRTRGLFWRLFVLLLTSTLVGGETVMVDYGCDNGRLFCVLLTIVENLSSPRGRKTNEEKINSQFAILQSLVLLCDVLTEGSVLSACGSGSQSRGSRMPNTPPTLSHPSSSSPNTHKHTPLLTYKGVLRSTPEYSMIFGLFKFINNAAGTSLYFRKCRLNILNEYSHSSISN